jgi:Mn-dependent DtxR family transcriptional regulator
VPLFKSWECTGAAGSLGGEGYPNFVPAKNKIAINTESVDDYLKAMLELSGPEEQRVTSNVLAERLGVRAASVTGMLQRLAAHKPAFVKYAKHHGALLTAAGRHRALEVLRHHRLLERFLHDVLDFPWDEVHAEASSISFPSAWKTALPPGWEIPTPTLTAIPFRIGTERSARERKFLFHAGLVACGRRSAACRIEILWLYAKWSGLGYAPVSKFWSNPAIAALR